MNTQFIEINGKTVQLSQPYTAEPSELVGRDKEMRKILASWMGGRAALPMSPLLTGAPGVGKNRIVYECARLCGKELYIYQGHEDVTAEDIVCAVRFSDDPDRKLDYIVSPVVTAMINGAACFIDEIAKIRPRALAPLSSLLDERRYLDSNLLGERIYAHPGFRAIAATNTSDLESGQLPDFIRSRMRPVVNVGYPGRAEIERIIMSRFQPLQSAGRTLLDIFWKRWDKNFNRPPTPRDSIFIFGYALNFADFEKTQKRLSSNFESAGNPQSLMIEHLEIAIETFNDSVSGSA